VRPKKRLGQHFLKSPEVVARVVDIVRPEPGDTIIEIGPGRGALTMPLANSGANVVAVEFDREAAAYLEHRLASCLRVRIINQDFLTFEPAALGLTAFKLVGNLPYNITSPVVEWTTARRETIIMACFMVQKEMAARLSASPGGRDWSPLSIFTQLHFDVEHRFDIGPEHFQPSPRVVSSVITLRPGKPPQIPHPARFEKLVRSAFRQRRKLLVNNLVPGTIPDLKTARAILRELNLHEKCRAEELSTAQFLTLTERLVARKII
jgi:16S rRNA (adenine1518-N6/adenine1519-N6)-dimethyltransferase